MKNKNVLVTGASGMIGHVVVDKLIKKGYNVRATDIQYNIITEDVFTDYDRNQFEFRMCDLRNFNSCKDLVKDIDIVYHVAGIKGNPQTAKTKPSRYFVPLLQFNTNMMEAARLEGVDWYLYTSSVGVYRQDDVLEEDSVWKTFPTENDTYPAWAKRMGELQAHSYEVEFDWENYSIVRPANVYGPYDNFGEHSMVIPSLIKKANENDVLNVWGDGSPIRDFIYSEDVADGMIHMVENKINSPVNLASGNGVTIREIAEIVGKYFNKEIVWDKDKPMGDMKRILSTERAESFGFKASTSFEDGIIKTIEWYLEK